MNLLALKQLEIIRKIEQLPNSALAPLNRYLDQFWQRPPPVPRSLKGIWKHQGFERIHDLEGELKTLRAELNANILKREL
jgi:hypothetical protein